MTLYRLFLVVAAISALAACTPLVLVNVTIPEDGFVAETGLRYGPEERQALDVYLPKDRAGPSPVVVFFYGGAWRRGERGDHLFAAEALTSQGYVAVVPDYRLYPEVRFPAFVEDGAKALRWVRDHAADFGGDPDRLYLMGHSAGAHIAALLTLDERYLAAELLRLEGEGLRRVGPQDASRALQRLRGALALARRQGARSLERRALASLAGCAVESAAARAGA